MSIAKLAELEKAHVLALEERSKWQKHARKLEGQNLDASKAWYYYASKNMDVLNLAKQIRALKESNDAQ